VTDLGWAAPSSGVEEAVDTHPRSSWFPAMPDSWFMGVARWFDGSSMYGYRLVIPPGR
jgi:hypothetical protein